MISLQIQKALEKTLGKHVHLYGTHHVGGGFVNQTYKATTSQGNFFIKAHENTDIPKMFERESNGLILLSQASTLDVVKPKGFCDVENFSFLLLDWLESAPESPDFWSVLGEGIAKIHKKSAKYFGLNEDNYFGSLAQTNSRLSNWGQFFVRNRLMPMVKLATENSIFDKQILNRFDKYFDLAENIFPEEEPSLLHGDLWKGNIMTNSLGLPCLIDPAVYYGHRELDIAMTKFVGNFPPEFYEAYQGIYPLQPDWEVRKDFSMMYYQLAHLNLFGLSYYPLVEENLHKWVGK